MTCKNITQSISKWLKEGKPCRSEFLCAVCGKIFLRTMPDELPNITIDRNGKYPIATSFENDIEFRTSWVCSEECKITYTLQKE